MPETSDFGNVGFSIIEAVLKMSPEELRRSTEALRPKWERIGAAFPLYALLLVLSDDGPFEWRNVAHPVTDAQAAQALSITRRRAKRWRRRLAEAKLVMFLGTPRGFAFSVRDNPPMRELLSQVVEMGRNTERGLLRAELEAEIEQRRAQLLRSLPADLLVN